MNPADTNSPATAERETLTVSLLNDFLYCPRRAALKLLEGWRNANEHTARGDIVHEHADLAGYEVAKGVLLWRALPVFSDRLGLSGKCDVVEVHPTAIDPGSESQPAPACPAADKSRLTAAGTPRIGALYPVEFKLGKRRRFDNDDAQLCAQALCLEEMFGIVVPRGAIYHADSKRRREVELTPQLRALTEKAVADLRTLLDSGRRTSHSALPPAVFKPACEECSLFETCLPKATGGDSRAARLARQLFET